MYLNNLGSSYRCRFGRTGELSDISEAISLQQQAVQLTPNGHADIPPYLNNLGHSYGCRFRRTGELSDIEEAISAQQRAVQLTPNGHAHMPARLNNLGTLYLRRFERTGELSDISEAISTQQRAVQLTPHGHADIPMNLNNIGTSYLCRFERTGELADISEAISAQQQAVQLTPNGHTDLPMHLNNLGVSYLCHFGRTRELSDISEAISAQQRAVQLTPNGHADIPAYLNNLGKSYGCRFGRTGELSDIEEAISAQQRAVQLTPNGHADMPACLNNLGSSYQRRFQHTGESSDISDAISSKQQAVQLTPNGHADKPARLKSLGLSFECRFDRTNDPTDIHTSLSIYQKSATTVGPPSIRLDAARRWAQLSKTHELSQSLTAYDVAIDLVSQIAGMDRTIGQRHTHLTELSNLTTSAASAAFAQGEIRKAFEWLEQGRCLVWSQLNQLRTPVDNLREHDKHLAQRFMDISSSLESSGSRRGLGTLDIDAPLSHKMSLQDEAHTHIKLAGEWDQLLDEIRRIPSFHNFLRPLQTSGLLNDLPADGPIIVINVHETRCDALALISGFNAPVHIPLDNFTHKLASELREILRSFLSSRGVRLRDEDRGPRPVLDDDVETQSEIHFILEQLWRRVVKPILDGLEYSVRFTTPKNYRLAHFFPKPLGPLNPRRIWCCPTGPLVSLPLHAAGIYSRNETCAPGSCMSDFAVSSYTPTVSALLSKVKMSPSVWPVPPSKLLIISQPNTPGRSPIPCTTKEMDTIWKTIGSSPSDSLRLEAEKATVTQVKLEMASHSSIHFACHASQDINRPLSSGFYLHDGRLELAEIMKLRVAHSELAFLSACQTSTGDEKLSEEAVHLAAGMLAVGYRSVVATMWSIKDKYGPVVAESFYQYLMDKGRTPGKPNLDTTNAAHALHHATQCIREQVGDTERGLLTWVPYVHFGY